MVWWPWRCRGPGTAGSPGSVRPPASLLEPLECRCLLSGFVGPGDVNPNEIRVGQELVVDADQNVFLTIERASRKVEIAKHGRDGGLLWSNTIRTGTAFQGGYPLAPSGDGGVVVAGGFSGLADFDPGDGSVTLGAAKGRRSLFVAEYDADGRLVWAQAVTGKGRFLPAAIAVYGGQVVVAGSFKGTFDFDPTDGAFNLTSSGGYDMALVRFDADGRWLSAEQISGRGDDRARSVAIDAAGTTYLAGQFKKTIDADPGPGVFTLTSSGSSDGMIARLNDAGDLLWAGQIGGRGDDAIIQAAITADGEVWVGGQFSKTADLDPTEQVRPAVSAGRRDAFLAKLDADGGLLFAGTLPARSNQYFTAMATTSDGGLLVTGQYVSGLDLDPGPGQLTLNASEHGVFTLRLARSGSPQWARWFGGGRFEYSWDIATDHLGRVWTLGNCLNTRTDFDPGPDTFYLTGHGVFLSLLEGNGDFVDAFLV
jgi:hypothetical protein